jgi:hypothetical protein
MFTFLIVDASLIGHSAPSLSHVRSKIAAIVSIINRFMTFMTYALRDLSDTNPHLRVPGCQILQDPPSRLGLRLPYNFARPKPVA